MFIGPQAVSVILMEDSDIAVYFLSLGSHVHSTKHYLMSWRPKIVTLGVSSSPAFQCAGLCTAPWWQLW